jgi:hypothetical protein
MFDADDGAPFLLLFYYHFSSSSQKHFSLDLTKANAVDDENIFGELDN